MAGLRVAGLQPPFLAAPDLLDWLAGGDRLPGPAGLADPRLDPPVAECSFELSGGIATVGPQLAGVDALGGELVEQGEQVALLVLVAGREPNGERSAFRVDG